MKKRILNYECNYRQSLMLKCGLVVLIASLALETGSALANVRIGSSGTIRDLDKYSTFDNYEVAAGKLFVDIVGIGIDGSNDHVSVWHEDGTVTSGYSKDFTRYQKPRKFNCPPGKSPRDIVAMAIGRNDRVSTWYKDRTRSVGTSTDLDKYQSPKPFTLPPGKRVKDIIGIAIGGPNNRVSTWFKDGAVYSGSSLDLDGHSGPKSFTLRTNTRMNDVIGIGRTSSNGHAYVWHKNSGRGVGAENLIDEIDAAVHAFIKRNRIPGMTVALSKDGMGILSRGYGYANIAENKSMTRKHRSPIGSVSKMFGALAWMKISERNGNFSEKTKLYGSTGILNEPQFLDFAQQSGTSMQWYRSLKIAHLMTHSAGFKGGGNVSGAMQMFNVSEDDLTYEQIHLHFLKTRPLTSKPGTKYDYSNHGMGLMGTLIRRASGKSYAKYATDNIFKPANVSNPNTGIVPFRTHVNQFDSDGHSYQDFQKGLIDTKMIEQARDEKNENILYLELPAGGWSSTAGNLVKVMMATDQKPNHPDILKPATLKKMEKPYFSNVKNQGLGWGVSVKQDGSTKVSHGGARAYGNAYMAKFLPGYKSDSGKNLGGINVAICINIDLPDEAESLSSLANRLVIIAAKTKIRSDYDIAGSL